MKAPLIIGITGHARSGKDTVAQILCEAYNFKKMSFADPLKADLVRLDPIIGPANIRVSDVLRLNGGNLEGLKEFDEWRELCQRYGTDVWRTNEPDFWVERLRAGIYEDWSEYETPGYVVPDVRFLNERSLVPWTWMIKVERPGVGAANEHVAEKYIDELEVDFVLQNDGTIEDLVKNVLGYVNSQLDGSVTYEK